LMLAARIRLAHLAVSSTMDLPNSAADIGIEVGSNLQVFV
jgi:hypothetical protein